MAIKGTVLILEQWKTDHNTPQTLRKKSSKSTITWSERMYFGPKAPAEKEASWAYTAPGKQWLSIFCFYGPDKAVFDKTWKLPDIESTN